MKSRKVNMQYTQTKLKCMFYINIILKIFFQLPQKSL